MKKSNEKKTYLCSHYRCPDFDIYMKECNSDGLYVVSMEFKSGKIVIRKFENAKDMKDFVIPFVK